MNWLRKTHRSNCDDYWALWHWSTIEVEEFWRSIWDFFDIQADGSPDRVLVKRVMPGARWFPDVSLNYAEHVFRCADSSRPALIAKTEGQASRAISWQEFGRDVGAVSGYLRAIGIGPGDRVVSFLPNIPETVIAFLACASIGAIWSSCAPDMGVTVVLDRFKQIAPKVVFAVDSYTYNGKCFDRVATVADVLSTLPSVQHVIHVRGPLGENCPAWPNAVSWDCLLAVQEPLRFARLPFDTPLWVVYSSGTTGLPKAMVHGHGGILLTQLKTQQLQHDLQVGDRLAFLGSTGWIVWNHLVGGLLSNATIGLYDGNPAWPNVEALWRFLDDERITHFGCGATYLMNCMKAELKPREFAELKALRAINSTGSPLALAAYKWVYEAVKSDVWLASVSGGTDIASGFVSCAPILPVSAGEIQCPELGVAACALNEAGNLVVDEVGELVITSPIPSMPVFFWNDPDGKRYHDSYFTQYPGLWRHGDWIRFTSRGTSVIYGRSDTTINRNGIRMGTAEIYRAVEALPEILDSMVVDLEYLGRPSYMPMFVVLRDEFCLDETLKTKIKNQIRINASARHVPDDIFQVVEIPTTLTGKKMELPVRKLLLGASIDTDATKGSMSNPASLSYFVNFSEAFRHGN